MFFFAISSFQSLPKPSKGRPKLNSDASKGLMELRYDFSLICITFGCIHDINMLLKAIKNQTKINKNRRVGTGDGG